MIKQFLAVGLVTSILLTSVPINIYALELTAEDELLKMQEETEESTEDITEETTEELIENPTDELVEEVVKEPIDESMEEIEKESTDELIENEEVDFFKAGDESSLIQEETTMLQVETVKEESVLIETGVEFGRTQYLGDMYEITNPRLECGKTGVTTFYADITNISKQETDFVGVEIYFYDSKNNLYSFFEGIIPSAVVGEQVLLNAGITENWTDKDIAYYRLKIKKTGEMSTVDKDEVIIDSEKLYFGDHTYQYFEGGISWYDAKKKCEELGGYLLVVSSEEEQKAINTYVKELEQLGKVTKQNVWLGSTIENNVLDWVAEKENTYTNWAQGEPNNVFGMQDCVMMYTSLSVNGSLGYWNDENGNGRNWDGFTVDKFGYICEWGNNENSTGGSQGERLVSIIDEVAMYTLDEVYAQWDVIINSNFSHEEKMRRLTALANNYGITDVQEGIKYFSKVSSHTRDYLYLTTNENYCAYDWAYWLNTTPSGKLTRGELYADGLIFNFEFLTYIDWTTYANGSYPGVEKCKTMLKRFIEDKNDDNEIVEVAQLSKKLTKGINNAIKLNNISVDFQMEQIMDGVINAQTKEELLKYQEQFTNILIEQARIQQKIDIGGEVKIYLGADGIAKAMDYAGPIIEVGADTIEDVIDIMNLEEDIKKYQEYKEFLTTIYSSPDVSKEMRIAAYQLCDSLINSYIKEVQSILSHFIEFEDGMMYMDKGLLKTYLESNGLSTTATSLLGEAMRTITLATVISNIFIDAGDFVKQAAYTQAYAELAALYSFKLQEDKQAFCENPSEENAWKFYEDYNLLWRLRYEGEEQFLKMNTVDVLFWRIKTNGYNYREEVVKDVQSNLKQCQFELADNIIIPESVQYVKKAVISCPVDILVYTKSGVLIAELKDGVTSDITNEYGRFVVVYDSYSGEYIKVICQSTDDELVIQIVSVDDGLVDYKFAQNNTDGVLYFDKVLVEAGDIVNVIDSQYQVVHSTGEQEDVVQLEILNEEYIKPESVLLDTETLELFIGEEYVVETSVVPINTTNKDVSWYSENEEIVEVKNGVIIAKSVGETVVHAKACDSDDVENTIVVKVIEETHIHDWRYESDSNVIRVKCIETSPSVCQYNINELTFTVKASDIIYSDNHYVGVSFVDSITSVIDSVVPTITYYKVKEAGRTTGGTKLESVPKDAGYYYVEVLLGNVSAVKGFSILANEITNEMVNISKDVYMYDGTEKKPIITIVVDGKQLVEGIDYTLSGVKSATDINNLYSIKITGKGNYKGVVKKAWRIISQNISTGIIADKEDEGILMDNTIFDTIFKDTQSISVVVEDEESGVVVDEEMIEIVEKKVEGSISEDTAPRKEVGIVVRVIVVFVAVVAVVILKKRNE